MVVREPSKEVWMWLRNLRRSTVSKEEGDVRGGGRRRAEKAPKTRSDVANGRMIWVALENHGAGVQTP